MGALRVRGRAGRLTCGALSGVTAPTLRGRCMCTCANRFIARVDRARLVIITIARRAAHARAAATRVTDCAAIAVITGICVVGKHTGPA